MNRLVALDLTPGPGWVDALRRAWDEGDAVFPIDRRLPPPARATVLDAMAPAAVVHDDGVERRSTGRPVEPGDALVVATSGSTGVPKGVVLTHAAVAASASATSARLGVTADDHWLACLPLAHIGGLSVVTRALASGTPVTVHDSFDAERVQRAAADGVTLVSLVATALARLRPEGFRTIVLGGARPPASLPPNVVTTYGMTETGSGVVYDGIALEGVEVRVQEDGEIWLRGPMLLRTYRSGEDPKRADGWFPTGDVGLLDPQGRLVVHGRRGDVIVTGGEKVWPEQVEPIVRSITGIADAAVTGLDDPEWGQVVTAVVVAPDDATESSLSSAVREAVKAVLPAYCAPRRVLVAEEIPRTALGKVRRAELRALAERLSR